MILRKQIISLFFIGVALSVKSQNPHFKSIQLLRSGQPLKITAISQDSTGYMWFSSSKGLIKYDGVASIFYNDKDSVDNSPVTCIYASKDGITWFGHKNGQIEYYQNNHFYKFKPEEGLSASEVSFISTDKDGTLWFGTLGEGVYYYKGKNRKRLYNLNSDDGLNNDYVYCMAQHQNGDIFLGTDNGIALINPDSLSIKGLITMRNGLPDNIIRQMFIDGDRIWLGTDEKGVCILDAKTHAIISFSKWLYNPVTKIIVHNFNECWVTTAHDGLINISVDKNSLYISKQFTTKNGLPSNYINTIYTDFENNLWCGSNEGLCLLANSPFEFINSELNGFNFGNTYCFVTDKKNNYWAATESGLIKFTVNPDGKADYKIIQFNQFNANSFISLYCDQMGFIWAGTYGNGVFRIHPESLEFKRYTSQNGLSDDNILHITGTNDDVWMATAGGGAVVYHLVSQTFEIFNSENGLASDYVYSVYPDITGVIWFGLDGRGVSVLKDGKITTTFLPDSLGIHTVYSIAGNSDGKYWFQTDDKGLLAFDGRTYTFLSNDKGKIGFSIRSILCFDSDKLIIVNNESIQLLSTKTSTIETFGSERGVAYLEPNINGIYSDELKNVWISTNNGIVKLNLHSDNFINSIPKIEITNKLLFDKPIDVHKKRFKYNENNLTFEYSGFWYQGSENLTYRYKILNYDIDWSRPVNIRQITYSNISPGEYTFMVEVSNNSGVWISNPKARFSFIIRPPFYKTWWFTIICIVTIVLSVYYYIKRRTIKLIKAKEALELEVQKRTETIMIQKEEIATQRDEIEEQRDFVIQQRDKIARQNEHITSGIQYASRIQTALLIPDEEYSVMFKEIFILNRPMNIVSGDFYWFKETEKRLFVVVADCTGHGVSGAFMSVMGLSFLGKIVNSNFNLGAGEILDLLRDEIKIALRQTGKSGETKDGMDIAILIVDKADYTYQLAGANNPVILIRNNELLSFKTDRMPIGIYPLERPFTTQNGTIIEGDIFYMFSDGYADQLGGPEDHKFQTKQFKEILLKNHQLPFEKQKNELNETMNKWKGERNQNDDILVIGFRII